MIPAVIRMQLRSGQLELTTCLKNLLVPSPLKQASIGQCLLKAAKERSVLHPLMFGLAVELDNIFGSKWLIKMNCVNLDLAFPMTKSQNINKQFSTQRMLMIYYFLLHLLDASRSG